MGLRKVASDCIALERCCARARGSLVPLVALALGHDFCNVVNQVPFMGLTTSAQRAHAAYLAHGFSAVHAQVYAGFCRVHCTGRSSGSSRRSQRCQAFRRTDTSFGAALHERALQQCTSNIGTGNESKIFRQESGSVWSWNGHATGRT